MTNILITGANRGLGLEFVKQYAHQEYQVIACCRDPKSAAALTNLSAQFPHHIQIQSLDVSKPDSIKNLANDLKGQSIDILLNNAGIYGGLTNSFGNIDYNSWEETLRINTLAPMRLAEAFVQHVASSDFKKMVFMSSKMGSIDDNSGGGHYVYRSSKTALNSVVKSLSIDLKLKGIATLTLHPGWVRTDMGGPNGLIDAPESITGMIAVIQNLGLENSGEFLAYDGKTIPW